MSLHLLLFHFAFDPCSRFYIQKHLYYFSRPSSVSTVLAPSSFCAVHAVSIFVLFLCYFRAIFVRFSCAFHAVCVVHSDGGFILLMRHVLCCCTCCSCFSCFCAVCGGSTWAVLSRLFVVLSFCACLTLMLYVPLSALLLRCRRYSRTSWPLWPPCLLWFPSSYFSM